MLEEIAQQPAALRQTIESGVPEAAKLRKRFESHPPDLVVIAARGSSDHAAQFAKYLIELTTGIPVLLAAPSVLTSYGCRTRYRNALVLGISQSGESTDINAVLEDSREAGLMTLGITSDPESTIADCAGDLLPVRAGREESVAATKTYTGQLAAVYLLAWALGAAISHEALARIPDQVAAALRLQAEVIELVQSYTPIERAISIGRGLNYCNALEFGLKLMETSYVSADRFSSADLLHGPFALVEKGFPAFLFAAEGATWVGLRFLIERLASLHAETLVFTDLPAAATRGLDVRILRLPSSASGPRGLEDLYSPISLIVPAQLFAAHLSSAKGIDPDRPRGLSKITRTM